MGGVWRGGRLFLDRRDGRYVRREVWRFGDVGDVWEGGRLCVERVG